jgi:putative membrane-bound dehydrogenase-like protein
MKSMRTFTRTWAILVLCSAMPFLAPAEERSALKSPLTTEQAWRQFRVEAGLRIELAASEPQIESPVAMAFDEDGRMWVVEMRDYPNGPGPGQKPAGRIRILEDRDGDGFFEHSRVFADNLLFANGLMPWKGGVVVTAAPHIVYLAAGSGAKATSRDILYEGFAAQNPQLRVSHPNLGVDNWVYVANGLRGGQVHRPGRKDAPLNLGGRDFRFDLIHDRGSTVTGMGQYGLTFDDWGRRFLCDNRHHLRHVVLEDRYLERNPYLAAGELLDDISILDEGPLYSGGKIYPLSKNWTTSSLHAGRFTAACSVFIYRGHLLPEKFRGAAFTCDPTGNLVHGEILRPRGATFEARPIRDGVEFLASPDDWFRPVFLTTGPEGALYVVDMYRAVIEHPEWMPPELQHRPDLLLGKDKGRIWRVVPNGVKVSRTRPHLSRASIADLVSLLEEPDAWWRTTAQRLLLEKQDRAAIPLLKNTVRESPAPLARLHAAWLLESFQALDEGLIQRLLHDPEQRVREHGLVMAETQLAGSPRLQEIVTRMVSAQDARCRYQAALTLGTWNDDCILEPLACVARLGADDRWTRLAVASAVPARAGKLLSLLLADAKWVKSSPAGGHALVHELTAVVGARRNRAEIENVLQNLRRLDVRKQIAWQLAGLKGIADGLSRRGGRLADVVRDGPLASWLAEVFRTTARLAADASAGSKRRIEAMGLLAHASWESAGRSLEALLDDPIPEIRVAAVRSLAAQDRPEIAPLLMRPWRSYTPALRREVLEAMFHTPARIELLLSAVEKKTVKPGDIDAARTRHLLQHPRAEIRSRARKLLQDSLPADRKSVLAQYRAALKLAGDAGKGREIFKKNCATCHRIAGIGVDVGPDISDTRTKTMAALLVDILNPNQAIDNNAINFVVVTKSGKSLNGIIVAENAAGITLRRAEGLTDTILREDIDTIQSTGVSLMPEGLEKSITVPEMADLLSFLKNWRYLDGSVPGR